MAIGAAVKAAQLGYRFAPSLMNFGRKLFSPGPWKMPHMVPKARGFGKVPKVKYIPATRNMAGARVAERIHPYLTLLVVEAGYKFQYAYFEPVGNFSSQQEEHVVEVAFAVWG